MPSSIYLRTISEVPMNLIYNMYSKITFPKLLPHLLGANELVLFVSLLWYDHRDFYEMQGSNFTGRSTI